MTKKAWTLEDVAQTFRACEGLFHALGDPARQQIVLLLAEHVRLNVNQITAGLITIYSNIIETTTGVTINFDSPVNFTAGIRGTPLALGLFLQG